MNNINKPLILDGEFPGEYVDLKLAEEMVEMLQSLEEAFKTMGADTSKLSSLILKAKGK